jgi:hypothetical protein
MTTLSYARGFLRPGQGPKWQRPAPEPYLAKYVHLLEEGISQSTIEARLAASAIVPPLNGKYVHVCGCCCLPHVAHGTVDGMVTTAAQASTGSSLHTNIIA